MVIVLGHSRQAGLGLGGSDVADVVAGGEAEGKVGAGGKREPVAGGGGVGEDGLPRPLLYPYLQVVVGDAGAPVHGPALSVKSTLSPHAWR